MTCALCLAGKDQQMLKGSAVEKGAEVGWNGNSLGKHGTQLKCHIY